MLKVHDFAFVLHKFNSSSITMILKVNQFFSQYPYLVLDDGSNTVPFACFFIMFPVSLPRSLIKLLNKIDPQTDLRSAGNQNDTFSF